MSIIEEKILKLSELVYLGIASKRDRIELTRLREKYDYIEF